MVRQYLSKALKGLMKHITVAPSTAQAWMGVNKCSSSQKVKCKSRIKTAQGCLSSNASVTVLNGQWQVATASNN